MKNAAILLNIAWLLFAGYQLYEKGIPDNDEIAFVLLVCLTPFVSIWAISKPLQGGLFALYLERKALEERVKIDALKKQRL